MKKELFSGPLRTDSRIAITLAALLILPALFMPLWSIELFSPQYPEGLRMYIYSFTIKGDLNQINILNHYIGMKKIEPNEFAEFRLVPFFVARFVFLALVAAVSSRKEIGAIGWVDFIIFGTLMVFDLYSWLYAFGHNLDPKAAMKIEPFTPPVLGSLRFANFRVISMPGLGAIFMGIAGLFGPLILLWDYFRDWKTTAPLAEVATQQVGPVVEKPVN